MKYILTIDDDEALCKLVKKCIETEQVPVYTFLRGEDALSFFYDSETYKLISNGVADMHCLSDEYLADELLMEWKEKYSPL